jgi:hypothetical protein
MHRSRLRAGLIAASLAWMGPATAAAPTFETKSPKPRPVIITPPTAEVLAEAIKAEMDAYVRRMDVCTRLRQVAVESNDDSLATTADDLERQAGLIYQQRCAKMGMNTEAPPRAADTILDRSLGRGAAVDPLKVAPPKPAATATAGRAAR